MKIGFYPKLAWTGIKKNKRVYLPYIVACILMVMTLYLLGFLTRNETVAGMTGGDTMQLVLGMGVGVMEMFALILLFYTNSFLMKHRNKEFGLYHILGMGKGNVVRVLIWEALILAGIVLAAGLAAGVLFSKLGELGIVYLLEGEPNISFSVEEEAMKRTLAVFAGIFLLILLNNIRKIFMSKPIELLKSEAVGEKPPKANWLAACLGILLLGGAYYLAVTIEDPLIAMSIFFFAVAMVIVATYLLFGAGSVVLCRVLKGKKKYYYKANHFISVSSMMYRMRRNGAGLASICILSTMVLVMISAVSCLFFGMETTLYKAYPRDFIAKTSTFDVGQTEQVRETIDSAVREYGEEPDNILSYDMLLSTGAFQENQIIQSNEKLKTVSYQSLQTVFFVSIEDYNALMGEEETLERDEMMIYSTEEGFDYTYDTLTLENCGTWKIKKQADDFVGNSSVVIDAVPTVFLFVSDKGVIREIEEVYKNQEEEVSFYESHYYGFDLNCSDSKEKEIETVLEEKLREQIEKTEGFPQNITIEGRAVMRNQYHALYGGMFILGIILGIVFVMGTVLIMYYKQITEGYEDRNRFEILKKVGMTKRQIKKSINSQVLTVFFLPLIAAGIHTGFAFPMMYKILTMFGLRDLRMLLTIVAGCYLAFTGFYVSMYVITSRAYYRIVSGKKEE